MFAVSFAACLWRAEEAPMSAFFMLQYRAWELLAGSILAISLPTAPRYFKEGMWADCFAWMGLLLVLVGFVVFEGSQTSQGVAGLVACAGAVLLILSGQGGKTCVSRILGRPWIVGVGVISYSLYLWHWPLILFFGGESGGVGWVRGTTLFFLSIVLGWASWRWIEQPFRAQKQGNRKRVFISWAVLTLGFTICSNYIRKHNGLPDRFPDEVVRLLEYKEKVGGVRTKDHYDVGAAPVFGNKEGPTKVALWGDSHAEALIPGIEAAALESGASFRAFILAGQPPVTGVSLVQNRVKQRAEYNEAVFDKLLTDESIKVVILAARWSNPVLGRNEDLNPKARDFYKQDFKDQAQKLAYYAQQIRETVKKLHAAGRRVYVVDPVPEVGVNVVNLLARLEYENKPLIDRLPCPDYLTRNELVLDVFDELEKDGLITRIRPQQKLLENGQATILDGDIPIYRDDDHVTPHGARFLHSLFSDVFIGSKKVVPE